MSEIEKMYKNAEIKQLPTCNNCNMLVEYWSNGTYCSTCRDDKDNDECGMADYTYPLFTAEKQLGITKFLLKKAVYYDVKDDKYWFYYEECESAGYKPFDEAIAHFINKLWTDMSEEEKQQVKGILE